MNWAIPEFVGGLVLALATVKDVFETVVVPGGSRATLHIARRIVDATLPLWRLAGRGRSVPKSFAPFVLLTSFVAWMVLLTLGVGAMLLAIRDDFRPSFTGYPDALYFAGSSLLTIGLSGVTVSGLARWIVLAAGFCGLAVMTMAITYLLEVQGGIAQRDAGILKLTTTSGEPPSGLALLERYAALDFRLHVPTLMRGGRDWCAGVAQSHSTHPTLIYFRSKGTGSGWPATLGALMDLALIVEFLLDEPQWRGPATLLREDGGRMAEQLASTIGLRPEPVKPMTHELEELLSRLRRAGYRVRRSPDRTAFTAHREQRAACVSSLAHHLGSAESPLVGAPAAEA